MAGFSVGPIADLAHGFDLLAGSVKLLQCRGK